MTTASEEILARYKKSETEIDAFGRPVTLRLLRMPQQLAILRYLNTDDQANRVNFLVCACVRKIEDDDIPMAKSLAELEAVMNRLDNEGMEAAGLAYAKLKGVEEPKSIEDEKEAVKN